MQIALRWFVMAMVLFDDDDADAADDDDDADHPAAVPSNCASAYRVAAQANWGGWLNGSDFTVCVCACCAICGVCICACVCVCVACRRGPLLPTFTVPSGGVVPTRSFWSLSAWKWRTFDATRRTHSAPPSFAGDCFRWVGG